MKIRYSIVNGVYRKFVAGTALTLCVFALVGCSTVPANSGSDVASGKYEPNGGVMNLTKLRQNKMRTVNLSSPELRANPEMSGKFEPGQTLTLLDVEGAGQITRLHITTHWDDPMFPRKALLKIYWDGEKEPSVMCPVGDFF